MNIKEELPPHDIEVEQGVLGALLLHNGAYGSIEKIVTQDCFFEPIHQHIFGVISQLIEHGKAATPLTIAPFMPETEIIRGVTTKQYIAKLASESTSILTLKDFAATLAELRNRRVMMEVGGALKVPGIEQSADMAQWAIDQLDAITTAALHNATPAVSIGQAATMAIDAAAIAFANNGQPMGIPFGWSELDRKTWGMERGDLVIIAGRPGMGKTAFALGLARNVAQSDRDLKVGIWSLEMGETALAQRMMSDIIYSRGGALPYHNIRSGRFDESAFERLMAARGVLEKLPIHVDAQAGLTMSQIAARARKRKRRYGLDLLIIDHLGLVRPSSRYAGNKTYEIGETTGAAKVLAKELDCAVVLLSQLSRAVEAREDKRPTLADLRSSGDIEQDADTVIFLYRHAYYLENREPDAGTSEHLLWQDEMNRVHNKIEAILGKQRSGPVGSVELFCNIGCNAIRNLSNVEPN